MTIMTNYFVSQAISSSLIWTEMKEYLIKLSAKSSLNINFDDRSLSDLGLINSEVQKIEQQWDNKTFHFHLLICVKKISQCFDL